MSTCIAVVVDGNYQKYIPLFALFAKSSYPEYGLKIFLQGRLCRKTRKCMEKLDLEGVTLHEDFWEKKVGNKQAFKSLRWVIEEQYFADHDNVYIGDVDLLICREADGIEEVHIRHCAANDLPYSNCVRPHTTRLSGLHFIRREPYYHVMGSTMRKYQQLLLDGRYDFNGVRNEHLLYQMIVEAGLGLPKDETRIDINGSGPHHGLHLGIWRKSGKIDERIAEHLRQDHYESHFRFFLEMGEKEEVRECIRMSRLAEVKAMRRYFEASHAAAQKR